MRRPDARALREELARLIRARVSLTGSFPASAPTAPAMFDGNGVDERLLIRGSSRRPGPEVPHRFLEAIAGDAPIAEPDGGSGRLALADRVLADEDPFPRRVIVNRVWHHLFGRGIVATVDNLGVLGEAPTHPAMLDHLADGFVRDVWSLKRLIRSVVTSRTYRMASLPDPEADRVDAGNRLWHRRTVRRLEAEPLRDAILAVSGRLEGLMAGPSVPVHLTAFLQGRGRPSTGGPLDGDGRRSLYVEVRRNFLSPMMLAFDAPIPFSTVGRRNISNVPAQALILMNDPFVAAQARVWAERVLNDRTAAPEERITRMYREAFGRTPNFVEVGVALEFLQTQAVEIDLARNAWRDDSKVWTDLAHMLYNAKEFNFIP